jgi:predicted RNase H-like HicB family nuclease
MLKIIAVVEKGKDGLFSVYVIEGLSEVALNGQGDSVHEAIEDMHIALEECRHLYIEEGNPAEGELFDEIQFEYKYDIASLFDFFDELNVSSFARKIGMNESLLRKYRTGQAFASEKQLKKIETGLHELGKELCSAHL